MSDIVSFRRKNYLCIRNEARRQEEVHRPPSIHSKIQIVRNSMKFILFIFILLLPVYTVAQQQSDSQLAYTYYQNKEYNKAAEVFLKLYERNRSSSYLDFYIICLINDKQYDKAEETLKKYLKAEDNNKDFLINLGYIYQQQGKQKKSEEYYEKAIKKMIPHVSDIRGLANKFSNIREYDWVTQTYLKGRELLKQPDAFIYELGDNYMMARNFEKMFDLFLQSLQRDPGSINVITSKLRFSRSYDVGNNVDPIIEKGLAAIFKTADYHPVFDELGVWYALQKNNYTQAFDQAEKLNNKQEGKLSVYLEIAREAKNAKNFNVALQAYNRILEKGKEEKDLYSQARKEILNCKYSASAELAKPDYIKLAGECEEYMKEFGYISPNVDVVLLLSDIYAYHMNMPDTANNILKKGESIPRLNSPASSTIKSKRADLLAYTDNPWEATILYTQIEKANPNNDTGYEAKLKKAKLAYYQGDLMWAKAQFDAVKGATTKLISNDAIKMSHFINMNYEKEGDNSELTRLAETEYLVYKQQFSPALPILDSIIGNSPSGIADYASLLKANVLTAQHKPQDAEALLTKLKDSSEQIHIKAEAIFKLAGLKVQSADKSKALQLYKLLVSDYTGSVYSIEAGNRYRMLEKTMTANQPQEQQEKKKKEKNESDF